MQQRSTFHSFKHFFKEEQMKKGIYYADSTQLEKAAMPVWLALGCQNPPHFPVGPNPDMTGPQPTTAGVSSDSGAIPLPFATSDAFGSQCPPNLFLCPHLETAYQQHRMADPHPQPAMAGPQPPMADSQPPMAGPQPRMPDLQPPMAGPQPPIAGPERRMPDPQPPMAGPQRRRADPQPPVAGPQRRRADLHPMAGFWAAIPVPVFIHTSDGRYLIGEVHVLRFSLKEGVTDNYHIHVNPGKIPIGYHSDVMSNCRKLGLIPPNESNPTDGWSVLQDIMKFLNHTGNTIVYTMPDKVEAVVNFIGDKLYNAGEEPGQIIVFKLDYLLYALFNAIRTSKRVPLTKEHALQKLQAEKFKFDPGLRCEHHLRHSNYECTDLRSHGWAFTIMESCCPEVGIEPQPGVHLPIAVADPEIFRIHRRRMWNQSWDDDNAPSTSASVSHDNDTSANTNDTGCGFCSGIAEELKKISLDGPGTEEPEDND